MIDILYIYKDADAPIPEQFLDAEHPNGVPFEEIYGAARRGLPSGFFIHENKMCFWYLTNNDIQALEDNKAIDLLLPPRGYAGGIPARYNPIAFVPPKKKPQLIIDTLYA